MGLSGLHFAVNLRERFLSVPKTTGGGHRQVNSPPSPSAVKEGDRASRVMLLAPGLY